MPSRTAPYTATVGGRQINIAPLETINYAGLVAKEPAEVDKLLNAARTPGFFYLDLRDDSTKEILADLREMYALTERYFDQPHELKMKDCREGQDRG